MCMTKFMALRLRLLCIVVACILILSKGGQIGILAKSEPIELEEEEEEFIKNNPSIITAVDPEFSPYEFIDKDGYYKGGIAADYLKLIEIRTGLQFEILEGLSWEEAYDLALAGEVDLLPCVGITRQRKDLFLFSDVYLTYQRVLLSRQDTAALSFDRLDEAVIGVQRNSSHYSFLMSETDIEPKLYSNNDELLLALTHGEIDGVIANYASSRYRIKQLGLTNIKIDDIYKGSSDSVTEFGMAVNKDKEILVSIINKALSQITEEERIHINNKWLGGIEQAPDYGTLFRNIAIAVGVIFVILGMFTYWNYRLQKEISRRREVEEALVYAKKEAEDANKAKSIFLANMSHEIRTPMNAILGHAQILKRDKNLSESHHSSVVSINKSGEHLLELINDVLDMSKIEAGGKIQPMACHFSFRALLDEMVEMFEFRTKKYGLILELITDDSVPEIIFADKKKGKTSYH